jgi:hypothetical protein
MGFAALNPSYVPDHPRSGRSGNLISATKAVTKKIPAAAGARKRFITPVAVPNWRVGRCSASAAGDDVYAAECPTAAFARNVRSNSAAGIGAPK